MSDKVEKQLKTFQRTSKMKYIASDAGTILYQSNNKAEFIKMRQEYLDSLEKKPDASVGSPV